MADWFAGQLDNERTRQQNAGRRVVIFDADGNRIEDDEESAQPPAHLVDAVIAVLRLDRLKDGGAGFTYPDGLLPFEWAALDGLQTARRIDGERESENQQQKQQVNEDRARLDALRKR